MKFSFKIKILGGPIFFKYYLLFLLEALSNALKTSTGKAKITVFDWSELKSFKVARVLKWSAPGVLFITSAALAKLEEAST